MWRMSRRWRDLRPPSSTDVSPVPTCVFPGRRAAIPRATNLLRSRRQRECGSGTPPRRQIRSSRNVLRSSPRASDARSSDRRRLHVPDDAARAGGQRRRDEIAACVDLRARSFSGRMLNPGPRPCRSRDDMPVWSSLVRRRTIAACQAYTFRRCSSSRSSRTARNERLARQFNQVRRPPRRFRTINRTRFSRDSRPSIKSRQLITPASARLPPPHTSHLSPPPMYPHRHGGAP